MYKHLKQTCYLYSQRLIRFPDISSISLLTTVSHIPHFPSVFTFLSAEIYIYNIYMSVNNTFAKFYKQ